MNSKIRLYILGLFFSSFLLSPNVGHTLRQNNVRIDNFEWMHIQTEHFDIYFDQSTEALVPRMALYLEEAWKEVGETLDFQVSKRTPFFFFSNHNEFEQTNVVPIGEGTGGVTEAFKNRFLIFNDGSETWMKHVIYHEFGHVVQFNVLYGGWWKSIRLLKSPFYPLWLMEGMAEYVTRDIDEVLGDMVVRDSVYHKKRLHLTELQGFNHLKPNQVTLAYKTGEAAMKFLADEYGKEKVGELLVVMESFFDVSSALREMIGTNIHRFDFRFGEWLDEKYYDLFQLAKEPSHYGPQLTFGDGLPQANSSFVFSRDGEQLYYFSDRKGPSRLYAYDLTTKETKELLKPKWTKFENLQTRDRSLSISRDGRWLAFVGEKKQRDYLYLFDLEENRLEKIQVPFDQIRSPEFSPTEDHLVVVGMKRGFNDLYLINRDGVELKRLTNNPQDERQPVFSKNGQTVYYSGEVMNAGGTSPMGRDLFSVSVTTNKLKRVVSLFGEEIQPDVLDDGSLVFVRTHNDKKEMGHNLYRYDPSTKKINSMTNLVGGAFVPQVNHVDQKLYYVGYNNGERHIYLYDLPEKESIATTKNYWGDPPLKKRDTASITTARLAWPESTDSTLLLGPARPYQFKGSTDLFLPFFFYSTQEGLVGANVWQLSDYLGNHQVQQQLQYASGDDFVDLSVFYTYARHRPQFTIGFRNQQFYRDINEVRQRRELNAIGLVSYPLDRINSLTLGAGVTERQDRFLDNSEPETESKEHFWITGYSVDTVTGRYLVPTQGQRFNIFYQQAIDGTGGNHLYKTGGAEAVQYVRLPRESTIASRLFYGRSVGENPQVFRLGGVDRIRGVSRSSLDNKYSNVAFGSAEARIRLQYLHARTKFLFPDFFFKSSYLLLFDDVGVGWNNAQEKEDLELSSAPNSFGLGLSWPTFILQTFQLNFTVQWARRTDVSAEVWYITLGPTF